VKNISTKVSKRKILWPLIEKTGYILIQFLVSLILARMLAPADFGIIAITNIIIGIASVLTDSCFSQSLIQAKTVGKNEYSTVFYIQLCLSVFLYFIIFILSPFLAVYFNNTNVTNILRVQSLVLIINAFGIVQLAYLQRNYYLKLIAKLNIVSALFSGIISITYASYSCDYNALIAYSLSNSIIYNILLWHYSDWHPILRFKFNAAKELFRYGSKLLISGIMSIFFSNLVALLIGKIISANELGYYNIAKRMKDIPAQLFNNINQRYYFSFFSRNQNEDRVLRRYLNHMVFMLSYFICPLLIMLYITSNSIITFVLSEKWIGAVFYFNIFISFIFFYLLNSFALTILKAKGRSDMFLKLEIFNSTVLLFALAICFLKYSNYFAVAESLINILACCINLYVVGNLINYNIKKLFKDLLSSILPGLIALIAVLLIQIFIINKTIGYNIILILFSISIYMLSAKLMNSKVQKYSLLKLKRLF
jgi:teichuronic acid exporter